jgi:hypothetical protein
MSLIFTTHNMLPPLAGDEQLGWSTCDLESGQPYLYLRRGGEKSLAHVVDGHDWIHAHPRPR